MIIKEDELICLKEFKYKDNDKIIRVLSRNYGNIQLVAKGSRKSKSKLLSIAQILSYSKCDITYNRDMYILTSGELIQNFYSIRTNLDAYFLSSYILELVDYVSMQNSVEGNLFNMVIKFFTVSGELAKMADSKRDMQILVAMFEIKLAAIMGYRPEIKKCIYCGEKIIGNGYMNSIEGGLVCKKCREKNGVKNLIYFGENNIENLNGFVMTKFENYFDLMDSDNSLLNFIRSYLHYHIGKSKFKTLEIFNKM